MHMFGHKNIHFPIYVEILCECGEVPLSMCTHFEMWYFLHVKYNSEGKHLVCSI